MDPPYSPKRTFLHATHRESSSPSLGGHNGEPNSIAQITDSSEMNKYDHNLT